MSNGEHEIRTPKGLRIGNHSVVDGKNMLQIKRGGCEDYISAESLVERIHGLPVKSIEFITEEDQRKDEKTSVKNGMTGNWICVLVRVLMRLSWRSSQSRTHLSA